MGHAYGNYLSKTYFECYRKMPKNITVLFPDKIPLKLKIPPKNVTVSMLYLLQAQPALAQLLLACCCGSTTMCRRIGNCVDPQTQTDF